jgi:hypothetical protein
MNFIALIKLIVCLNVFQDIFADYYTHISIVYFLFSTPLEKLNIKDKFFLNYQNNAFLETKTRIHLFQLMI